VDRIFVDTSYVIALINRRDTQHDEARALAASLGDAELVTTDAVLLELDNALARGYRRAASAAISHLLSAPNVTVFRVDLEALANALDLFTSHDDKEWSLVDCLSFGVMRATGTTQALTADHHFEQAGFRALLRKTSP